MKLSSTSPKSAVLSIDRAELKSFAHDSIRRPLCITCRFNFADPQVHRESPDLRESGLAINLQGRRVFGVDGDLDRGPARLFRQRESIVQYGPAQSAAAGLGDDPQIGDFPSVALGMFGQQQHADRGAMRRIDAPRIRRKSAGGAVCFERFITSSEPSEYRAVERFFVCLLDKARKDECAAAE